MAKFKTYEEALSYFNIQDLAPKNYHEDFKNFNDSKTAGLKFGYHFLYQVVSNENKNMSYPKMAIFLEMGDEYIFLDYPRTWMDNTYYGGIGSKFCVIDKLVYLSSHVECMDEIFIFGIWKNKPGFKELKLAYETTMWYSPSKSHYRNVILNRILF